MVAGRILPVWMGWVLFVIGIAALVPPISWFAMLATALWVLIAGIWMVVQGPPAVDKPSPSPPGSVSWPEGGCSPGNEIGSHAIDPAGE